MGNIISNASQFIQSYAKPVLGQCLHGTSFASTLYAGTATVALAWRVWDKFEKIANENFMIPRFSTYIPRFSSFFNDDRKRNAYDFPGTKDVILDFNRFMGNRTYRLGQLFATAMAYTTLAVITSAAAYRLGVRPHPLYNKVLSYLGPLNVGSERVQYPLLSKIPFVKKIFS